MADLWRECEKIMHVIDERDKQQKSSATMVQAGRGSYLIQEKAHMAHSLPLSFPEISPIAGVTMYMRSKSAMKKHYQDMPDQTDTRTGTKLTLNEAHRRLQQLTVSLNRKRHTAQETRDEMDHQWRVLRNKEEHLKSAFDKFDYFVLENVEKRERSKVRLKYFEELGRFRQEEIDLLRIQHKAVTESKELMEATIREYSMYETYLNHVTYQSRGQYRTPADLVGRYEALISAKNMISKKQDDDVATLDNACTTLKRKQEGYELTLLGLMNTTSNLMDRYDKANFSALKWETIVSQVQDATSHLQQTLKHTRAATWHMYALMCKRKGMAPPADPEDIDSQLRFIKIYLKEAASVLFNIKHIRTKSTILLPMPSADHVKG